MANYQGLVDRFGRPIEKAVLTQTVAGPTLTGVRSPLTSYPGDGLTPLRLTDILRESDQGYSQRYYELLEHIEERDMHYTGVLGVRRRSVAQLDITVQPAGDDPASKEQAKLIEDYLDRDELAGELFNILDGIGKGESFTEINWDTSEGEWRPASLEWRDQRWFRPDRLDLTTPLLIGPGGEVAPLPAGKFIHLVARGKSGIPARSGLGRLACWFWLFKSMTVRDWAIYTATFGQPLRVGKYGAGATDEDKNTLFRAVANIAGDCAAIIPQSMLIEFVQPPSGTTAGGDLYKNRADWLDQQMSKATLGQTTTTDAVSGGHAVSQEHRQVQEDIERADAKVLAAALNRDLVRLWIDLQYGPQENYPRIRIGRPETEDLEQLTDAISKLVPVGLKVSAKEIRAKFGLSDPQPGEEVLEEQPQPSPFRDPGAPQNDPVRPPTLHAQHSRSGVGEADAEQEQIDALAGDAATLAQPVINSLVAKVADIVAHASTLEDVRAQLLALAPDMSTTTLALALRQAQVVARLSGRESLADG